MSRRTALLWSGGLMSTFRVCQLSCTDMDVLLIYIVDRARRSTANELAARRKILSFLRRRCGTRATFRETFVKSGNIPPDAGKKRALGLLNSVLPAPVGLAQGIHRLGKLFDYISCMSAVYGRLEFCIEGPADYSDGHVVPLLYGNGKSLVYDGHGVAVLDVRNTDPVVYKIFGNLVFPVLRYSGSQVVEWMKKNGFGFCIENSWHCLHPLRDNVPCGVCSTCRKYMERDMEYVLPAGAADNYRIMSRLEARYGRRIAEMFKEYVFGGNDFRLRLSADARISAFQLDTYLHNVVPWMTTFRSLQSGDTSG